MNNEKALFHLEKSLEYSDSLEEEFTKVAVLNNLALVHSSEKEKVSAAIQYLESALKICSRLGDTHREAALHNNLADLLHGMGKSEESMSHLKEAVRLFASVGTSNQPEIWKLMTW